MEQLNLQQNCGAGGCLLFKGHPLGRKGCGRLTSDSLKSDRLDNDLEQPVIGQLDFQ